MLLLFFKLSFKNKIDIFAFYLINTNNSLITTADCGKKIFFMFSLIITLLS